MKLSLCMALVALTCAIMPQTVHAQFLDGQVSAVDGDSLEMTGTWIRLFGIDAPEARQSCKRQQADWACGADAARQLREFAQGRQVRCSGRENDRYGRLVATCTADGIDLALMMIQSGLAIALPQGDPAYLAAEDTVRKAKFGIWGAQFETPASWRATNRREEASPIVVAQTRPQARRPPAARSYRNNLGCAIKGNRNYRGEWIYHLPGSNYYEETRPEDLFCTEEQAQAAGYRPSRAG